MDKAKQIDRKSRDRFADLMEAYLQGHLSNLDFDEAISAIESDDPLIEFCRRWVWYFYDDLKEHRVALDKEGWDFFYRLILLLRSDAPVKFARIKSPWYRCFRRSEDEEIASNLFPFANLRQLRRLRKRVPNFSKHPYPKSLENAHIRSKSEERFLYWFSLPFWPIVMLFGLLGCIVTTREIEIFDETKGVSPQNSKG